MFDAIFYLKQPTFHKRKITTNVEKNHMHFVVGDVAIYDGGASIHPIFNTK